MRAADSRTVDGSDLGFVFLAVAGAVRRRLDVDLDFVAAA
jgi:hypothetical protein